MFSTSLQKTGNIIIKNRAWTINTSTAYLDVLPQQEKKSAEIARHQPDSINQQCITKIK